MVTSDPTAEQLGFLVPWCIGWLMGETGVLVEELGPERDGGSPRASVDLELVPLVRRRGVEDFFEELRSRHSSFLRVEGFYCRVSNASLRECRIILDFEFTKDTKRSVPDCRWPIPGEEVADFPASDPLRLALAPQRERKKVVEEAWIAVLREMERRGRIDEVPSIFCAPALRDARVLEEEIDEVMGAVSRHPLAIDASDLVEAMKASVPFLQEVVHGTEKLKSAVLNMKIKIPDPVFGTARTGASISLEERRRRVAERDEAFKKLAEEIKRGPKPTITPHTWDFGAAAAHKASVDSTFTKESSGDALREMPWFPPGRNQDKAFLESIGLLGQKFPRFNSTGSQTFELIIPFTTREDEGRRLPTIEEAADTASRLLDSFGADIEEFPEFADALEACEMKREEVRTSLEFLTRLGDTLTDEQRAQLERLPEFLARAERGEFDDVDASEETLAAQLARAGEPTRDGDVFAADHIVLFHIQDREDEGHEQQEEARGEASQPAARRDEAGAGEQGDRGARDDVRDDRDADHDVPEEQTLLDLATGLINTHGLSDALEAFAICEPLVITTWQGKLAIFARGGRLHFMFHPRHGESIGLELNELDANDVIQACMAWLIGKRIEKGGLH